MKPDIENENKQNLQNSLLKQEDKQNIEKKEDNKNNTYLNNPLLVDLFDKNRNVSYGLTFLGRMIMTIYSLHGLFFCYNLILEFSLLIPGFLFTIENSVTKFFFSIFFISFSMCLSNILVIPTYEFLTFPYLKYRNPLSHLISFVYIYKEKAFNYDDLIKENQLITLIINLYLFGIWIIYGIAYLLSLFSNTIALKDIFKSIILVLVYLNYLTIFMNYFFLSIYLIIKILLKEETNKNVIDIIEKEKIVLENGKQKRKNIVINQAVIVEENEEEKCQLIIERKKEQNNIDNIDNEPKIYKVIIETNVKKKITTWSWKGINLKILHKINNYFQDKPQLPDLNLFSYIIEPLIIYNYKDKDNKQIQELKEYYYEDVCFNLGIFFKILLFILSLVIFFINGIITIKGESILYFFCLFFTIVVVSLAFNFPSCYKTRKTFGINICHPKYQLNENMYTPRNPNILILSRIISDVLMLLVSVGLVFIYYKMKDDDNQETFEDIPPVEKKSSNHNLLLPNICYSSVLNMPIQLYMPFINDAYYYTEDFDDIGPHQYSSLQKPNYRDLFYEKDYEITILGNLINEKGSVKMIQYNVINRAKNIELTILSIKGTTFNKDIYLDAQLFISSVFMTLLNTFTIINQKNLLSFKLMEYSLSIPYRIFFKYLIIDDYLKKLKEAYINNEYSFYKNVVIVGHSLGGGLAKLFGRMVNKQAISLSGPGINAFHSLWNYEGESENFEISAIDLVPDGDLVPRVEVSGGTIYRIICKFGAFGCHSKVNSLCEVLIMCNSPNYKIYCLDVAKFDEKEIKKIADSVKLNN